MTSWHCMYLQHLAMCKLCLPYTAVLLLPEGLGAAFVFDCCTCPLHGHTVPGRDITMLQQQAQEDVV